MRLDCRECLPSGMEEYLSHNGWHFNKRMCEFAVSRMKDSNGNKLVPITKEVLDLLLKQYGITINKDEGYDAVYVANMCKADHLGSAIHDELHMLRFVKDYIDDYDTYEGKAFTRYYADVIGSGTVLCWEELI